MYFMMLSSVAFSHGDPSMSRKPSFTQVSLWCRDERYVVISTRMPLASWASMYMFAVALLKPAPIRLSWFWLGPGGAGGGANNGVALFEWCSAWNCCVNPPPQFIANPL